MDDNDIVSGAWRIVFAMIEAGLNGDDPCRDDELSIFMLLKGIAVFDAVLQAARSPRRPV